jgi:hypothetical protein
MPYTTNKGSSSRLRNYFSNIGQRVRGSYRRGKYGLQSKVHGQRSRYYRSRAAAAAEARRQRKYVMSYPGRKIHDTATKIVKWDPQVTGSRVTAALGGLAETNVAFGIDALNRNTMRHASNLFFKSQDKFQDFATRRALGFQRTVGAAALGRTAAKRQVWEADLKYGTGKVTYTTDTKGRRTRGLSRFEKEALIFPRYKSDLDTATNNLHLAKVLGVPDSDINKLEKSLADVKSSYFTTAYNYNLNQDNAKRLATARKADQTVRNRAKERAERQMASQRTKAVSELLSNLSGKDKNY